MPIRLPRYHHQRTAQLTLIRTDTHIRARSLSPQFTPFPRTPIPSLRTRNPVLFKQLFHQRIKARKLARAHKSEGSKNPHSGTLLRRLHNHLLKESLNPDTAFACFVYAEERRGWLGERYEVDRGRRIWGINGDLGEEVFETNLEPLVLNMRLEVARVEEIQGNRLRWEFFKKMEVIDEGCWGQYVPPEPVWPVKPPVSPERVACSDVKENGEKDEAEDEKGEVQVEEEEFRDEDELMNDQ